MIKKPHQKSPFVLAGAILSLCIVLFIFLQPHIAAYLLPFKRQELVRHFVSEVTDKKKLSGQEYWTFREFYSPGDSVLDKSYHLSANQMPLSLGPLYNGISLKVHSAPFMVFTAPYMQSVDAFVGESASLQDVPAVLGQHILVRTNKLILSENATSYTLLFILPISEMQKTNGFFNYTQPEKDFMQGKQWLGIAHIQK